MKTSASDHQAANPTQYNIDAIAKLEAEALQGRTAIERASDSIVRLTGSVAFLLLQVLLLVLWIAVNLHLFTAFRHSIRSRSAFWRWW